MDCSFWLLSAALVASRNCAWRLRYCSTDLEMVPSHPVAGSQLSRTSAAEPFTLARRSIEKLPRPIAVISMTPKARRTLLRMDRLDRDGICDSSLKECVCGGVPLARTARLRRDMLIVEA